MNLYRIIQFLKYKWKAMGRHGTHSPFVYAFIEQILHDYDMIPKSYLISCPSLGLRFENILSRIAAHYQFKNMLFLPARAADQPATNADMVIMDGKDASIWKTQLDAILPLLKNESVVVIQDIHSSKTHDQAWTGLCHHPDVRMSIDLYGMGLLLFREEFKVQQHFVLQY